MCNIIALQLVYRSSTEEDDTYWSTSCGQREGDAFPKAFERDLVTPTNIATDKNVKISPFN